VTDTRLCATIAALATSPAIAQSIAIPFTDNFESGSLSSDRWTAVLGVVVNGLGVNEPSPSLALNVDAFDSVTTRPIAANILGTLGPVMTVSFWVQHRGVESGETLIVEYLNLDGDFATLAEIESDGVDGEAFEFVQFNLPIDGYRSDLEIRFVSGGNQGNDDWFIDNVRVGAFAGNNPPFTDDFEDGFDQLSEWATVFNADTPAEFDPNPPSGTTTARLNRDDRIETVPFFLGVEPAASQQLYVRFWYRAEGVEPGESLRVEYNAPDPGNPGAFAYKLFEEIVATDFSPACFNLKQFAIPMSDYSDEFSLRFTSVADEFDDAWLLDDVTIASTVFDFDPDTPEIDLDPNCAIADLAGQCGITDLDDVDAFIVAFLAGEPAADTVPPFGIVDLDDLDSFIGAFLNGCTTPYGEP